MNYLFRIYIFVSAYQYNLLNNYLLCTTYLSHKLKNMKKVLQLFILMLVFGLSQIQAQELNSNSTSGEATSLQISLPAGPVTAPPQSAVGSSADYQARSESSYTIQKSAGDKSACNVLMVVADDDASGSPIQLLLQAYGDLGAVDIMDARTATPTLGQLQAYDVVLTWSNYLYFDPVSLGNILADYIDSGGKVINLVFSVSIGSDHSIQGRFFNENYMAINTTLNSWGINSCLGSYSSGHPIMAGISNVCDDYRTSNTFLTPGSSEVASWADSELFIAEKDNLSAVTINAYVGIYYLWTGDMPDILHNSILYLYSPPPPPSVPLTNWGIFLSIFLFLSFAAIGIRKFF